ncbi:MAG: flavodoxin [Clostridiales bacterium]|nr:flavodoxin [Clostridiales bacterium]
MTRLLCLLLTLFFMTVPAIAEEQPSTALVVYFSVPENVDLNGVDAVAGASVMVKNDVRYGNVEYVARLIANASGADLWRIETAHQYPLEHDALLDAAADEQDANARPVLMGTIEDIELYDRIFLGFPNWWYDLPMPLYSFLESYDLSGKEIMPFTVHGGSGFSGALNTIAELQPEALVYEKGLSVSRNAVTDCETHVAEWLGGFMENE